MKDKWIVYDIATGKPVCDFPERVSAVHFARSITIASTRGAEYGVRLAGAPSGLVVPKVIKARVRKPKPIDEAGIAPKRVRKKVQKEA